jgi:Protein of unknown function (DUF3800)
VKLVYIDEAGISSFAHEPHLVVAAVIINPDTQWRNLERYYSDLAEELFPEPDYSTVEYYNRDLYRFVFHAKDIWHGSGAFPRKNWSKSERLKVLARLAQVPRLFNLRVAVGIVDREQYKKAILKEIPKSKPANIQIMTHVFAFVAAVQDVDLELSKNAPDEVAILIAEDTQKVKSTIKWIHEGYTYPFDDGEDETDGFSTKRIVDTVHFAKKQDSLLLQVADHCAFIVKRKAMKCAEISPFFAQIKPQLIYGNKPTKGVRMRVSLDSLVPA